MNFKTVYYAYLVMKKDLTEFYRIKARLVSMILLPIILMLLFGYMFPSEGTINHIPIAVVQQDYSSIAIALYSQFVQSAESSKLFNVVTYSSLAEAENQLAAGNVYAIVIFRQGTGNSLASVGHADVEVIVDQLNPTIDSATIAELSSIFSSLNLKPTFNPGFSENTQAINVHFSGLIPGTPSSFEFLAPGFIVMAVVLGGLQGLAMSVSRERELGTLEGLLAAPIPRFSIVIGKGLAQAVRGIISGTIIVIISVTLFGVKIYGNIFLMALVLTLGILSFIGLGIIATSLVSDQESAQLILMMIQLPMVFISGIMYPTLQLPTWLRNLAYLLPLVYTVSAFKAVMVLNAPISVISWQLTALSIYTVVTFAIAVPLFQKMVTR
ncbi:MAG: ABC transporter permease [Thermoproteota archaeon]|nr:ABC transporter permease [Candidatus Brockarchaeota archaeon]MBO3767843.1 ABC transporter permease [Candidatus Brockarchaeota archaeon]MBO3801822.1 ABC transporter permease [Candidatus Brockarchaeota archaeon]